MFLQRVQDRDMFQYRVEDRYMFLYRVQDRDMFIYRVQDRYMFLYRVQDRDMFLFWVQNRDMFLLKVQDRYMFLYRVQDTNLEGIVVDLPYNKEVSLCQCQEGKHRIDQVHKLLDAVPESILAVAPKELRHRLPQSRSTPLS
jgi:hypothetical protein